MADKAPDQPPPCRPDPREGRGEVLVKREVLVEILRRARKIDRLAAALLAAAESAEDEATG